MKPARTAKENTEPDEICWLFGKSGKRPAKAGGKAVFAFFVRADKEKDDSAACRKTEASGSADQRKGQRGTVCFHPAECEGQGEQCARAKSTAGEEGRFLASSLREGKKRESGRSCVRADRRAVQRRAERSGGSRGKMLSVHGQTREEMRTDAQTAGAFSERSCFPILSGGQKATKKAQQCCAFLGTGHPATTVTVASFRTWRGWRRDRRPVP